MEIMGKVLMCLHDVNMNCQLVHLMREQLCVHNIATSESFCWKNTSGDPWGQASFQWFRVMPCLLNIQAGRTRMTDPVKSLKGFRGKRKLMQFMWSPETHCVPDRLPCVPVAAVVVDWQGLGGAVCPQSSGPAAQTGDERTCWHSRFLYRQEVGMAAERMLCIISCFS